MLITLITGNPWNCESDALYSVYRTLGEKTSRNITLWCENPAGVKGESWDILEEECQPTTTTTGSSVTAVWTIEWSDATADKTEMTVIHTTENLVVNSSPKLSSFTFMSIFVTVFSVTVFIAVVAVDMIIRKVRKRKSNQRRLKDQVTRMELMPESPCMIPITWSFCEDESNAEHVYQQITINRLLQI
jgi:hypothetical protein